MPELGAVYHFVPAAGALLAAEQVPFMPLLALLALASCLAAVGARRLRQCSS